MSIISTNIIFFSLFLWPTSTVCFPEITTGVNFLYFLVTTTTTVGLGDITPSPTCVQGRIFTILAMVTGSSSLIVVLTEMLTTFDQYSSEIRRTMANEMEKKIGFDKVKTLLRFQYDDDYDDEGRLQDSWKLRPHDD